MIAEHDSTGEVHADLNSAPWHRTQPEWPTLDEVLVELAARRPDTVTRYMLRSALTMVALAVLLLGGHLVLITPLEHAARQSGNLSRLESQIAAGTAPCPGCGGPSGGPFPDATPLAILRVPALGIHEVVVEGTTGEDLMAGPGHLRDTVYPGDAGTSVIFGRRTTYGGPFGSLASLRPDATISILTGYGTLLYHVLDVRRAGQPEPAPPAAGTGWLVLVTASGSPYSPDGALYVDAQLSGRAVAAPAWIPAAVPPSQRALGSDTSTVWALAFYLQAMAALAVAAVVMWRRWGPVRAWLLSAPLALFILYYLADQVDRILPNLL